MLESLDVGFHLTEEPGFLVLGHGWHRSDDDLGVFEFNQVMKGYAALLLTGVVTVKDGVAGGLDFCGMSNLVRIGSGCRGLVVDDLPALNQVEDANQPR